MKRTHTIDSASDGKKKTRFVAPEDDPARFAEDVADQLETARDNAKGRRGKVRNEGYDSDSSDEGESVVRSRAKKSGGAAGAAEDDDDDMFAMGEKAADEDAGAGASGKKKDEKYLRLGDIEGQEFGNEASGSGRERDLGSEASEDEESESEGDPEDEDDAARRAKAGMGFELSSFNMREEMEEGKFTEDGSFVRNVDPHAMHDRWLEGTDEREMKRARRAQRARAKAERMRRRQEEEEERSSGGKERMEMEMLQFLQKGETVLEALARLGEKAKKSKGKEKGIKKSAKARADKTMDLDATDVAHSKTSTSASEKKPKPTTKIEQLTDLASKLMSLGDTDIYSKTYEHLLRSVRSTGNVEPDWVPPIKQYEYKWDVPEAQTQGETGEPQVFGPFGGEEMAAWRDASYFGVSGEKVKVREVGGEWGDWDDVVE